MNTTSPNGSRLLASAARTSRVRHRVVAFCLALATITYLDRACLGVMAGTIRDELGLSMKEMGLVFSAFTFAYALFEVPTAWWAERIGPRRVLTRIVAWWSAFTLLTAAATGFKSLLTVRFLFGAGEAGAWPGATRVFSRWIPAAERGRVQGVFFAGAHLAAGLTPPLVLVLAPVLGWRGVFLLFGSLGFVWAVAWSRWFRDRPEDHPQVNAAELAHISAGTEPDAASDAAHPAWRTLLSSRNVWLLCAVAFANSYGFYFVITWLPTYLVQLGLTKASLAFFAGLPMLLAVPADLLGGVATDALARRFGMRLGRALAGGGAYVVAATTLFGATRATDPTAIAILLAVAGGASMFSLAAAWAACIEMGAAQSGLVSATMNTVGQVGAMLSPIVLAWLVESRGDAGRWLWPLQIIAGLYALAAMCWVFIDASRRLRA